MKPKPTYRRILNIAAWVVVGMLPVAGALSSVTPQAPSRAAPHAVFTEATRLQAQIRAQLQPPPPGSIVFNDPSPTPSGHNLATSTYVGYQVCAGCHGRLTNTRPNHTVIQEWENPTNNAHANDPATLVASELPPNGLNVYAFHVADGAKVYDVKGNQVAKQCGSCHSTGAPKYNEPQNAIPDPQTNSNGSNGFDLSQDWSFITPQPGFVPAVDTATWAVHRHNMRLTAVQCENCHGPASQHVLSGGDPRFINRVPDPKQTCFNCHRSFPNEKGHVLTGPCTDADLQQYSSSMGHTHAAGALVTGTGGYEYSGEDYSAGHTQPHARIRTSCVTCHTLRNPKSPILDHSSILAKIEACRNCHGDASQYKDIKSWNYVGARQGAVAALLIALGGASNGAPDSNAGGGMLNAFVVQNGGNPKNPFDPKGLSPNWANFLPKYRRARWNFAFVNNDSSMGAHNFDYAIELVSTSITDLQKPGP
jgi:hypothetical protein